MASGGKLAYPNDASETPDTLQAVYEYDGFNMLWEHATGIDGGNYGRTEGIAFIGNNATLVLNRDGWELLPETQTKDGIKVYKVEDLPRQVRNGEYLNEHTKNFVQAIKAADATKLKCGIETGSIAAINAHMGNIAYKTGRKFYWDASIGMLRPKALKTMLRLTRSWRLITTTAGNYPSSDAVTKPLDLVTVLHSQVQLFYLLPRPGRFAQKGQAGFDAGIIGETADTDALAHRLPAVVIH